MNEHKNQITNNLRSSFKPIGVKSFHTLTTTSPKFEQTKMSPYYQVSNEPANKQQHTRSQHTINDPKKVTTKVVQEQRKAYNNPIKQTQTKPDYMANKKYSAKLEPSSIPPRKNSVQIANFTSKSNSQFHQVNAPLTPKIDKKEDLRTSFTMNSLNPKTFDREFLRKTTHGAFKPLLGSTQLVKQSEAVSTSTANTVQHSNKQVFKKATNEIRIEPNQNSNEVNSPPNKYFNKPNSNFASTVTNIKNNTVQQTASKKSNVVNGFYIGKALGAGKFGEVYLAKHVATGFVCALKKIVKAKVKQFNMIPQLIQQIRLHAFLNHPNIVQFYGVLSDEQNIYIALEYMEGGTLFDVMNQKEKLSEHQTVLFLRQTIQAIKYLHDIDIAHRDIKPQNIVISYGLAKLCDFGWAARVQGARKTYCGTIDYVPPEILERKEYDTTVDLWCIGVLAFELLTGRVPFEHKERKMIAQKIVNVDKDKIIYPETMSEQAKQFIENLVKKNPSERIKSYKLLDHPFLKKKEGNHAKS